MSRYGLTALCGCVDAFEPGPTNGPFRRRCSPWKRARRHRYGRDGAATVSIEAAGTAVISAAATAASAARIIAVAVARVPAIGRVVVVIAPVPFAAIRAAPVEPHPQPRNNRAKTQLSGPRCHNGHSSHRRTGPRMDRRTGRNFGRSLHGKADRTRRRSPYRNRHSRGHNEADRPNETSARTSAHSPRHNNRPRKRPRSRRGDHRDDSRRPLAANRIRCWLPAAPPTDPRI